MPLKPSPWLATLIATFGGQATEIPSSLSAERSYEIYQDSVKAGAAKRAAREARRLADRERTLRQQGRLPSPQQ